MREQPFGQVDLIVMIITQAGRPGISSGNFMLPKRLPSATLKTTGPFPSRLVTLSGVTGSAPPRRLPVTLAAAITKRFRLLCMGLFLQIWLGAPLPAAPDAHRL